MNEYAGYLANLKERNKVVAVEDILTDQGVLLAKSGTHCNKKICENILRFKLLKPLEDSVLIANQLTAKHIYKKVISMVAADIWLVAINNASGDKLILQRCCLRLEKYPLLLQKLTVLDKELPDIFHQALLSAYLAAICRSMDKCLQKDIEEAFLAGISHDLGLLHIDHYILTKKERLDADEWRKIQSHPVIGYEMLKRFKFFPLEVATAVLEHHENLDGSGYPRTKTAEDLGNLGQLIRLLDNVIAIYNRKFKPSKRSLHDVLPIIQMNMHSYFPDQVSVIVRMLKQVPTSPTAKRNDSLVSELIDYVYQLQHYAVEIAQVIRQANEDIGFNHDNKEMYALQNIASNIVAIISSAGLDDTGYSSSLKALDKSDQQAAYNEAENTRLMLEEIVYQIQGYRKSVSVFVSKNSANANIALNAVIQKFEETRSPKAPESLRYS